MATDTDKQSTSLAQSADSRTYATPSSGIYMPLHPSGKGWEIDREQVKIIKVIGKGAFSQVAKATVWNIHGTEEYTTVAVKMLKGATVNLFRGTELIKNGRKANYLKCFFKLMPRILTERTCWQKLS